MSKLANIKKETLKLPLRYLIYGPEGVGKSTLAAHMEKPIFFDIEEGSTHLEVARYPLSDNRLAPESYMDVKSGLNDLWENKHSYKTLVIDTIDALEGHIWNHVCSEDSGRKTDLNPKSRKLESIEDYGYGKGYTRAAEEWRSLLAELDRLREDCKMIIVLIGHVMVKLWHNPEGEDFDRYNLRVHEKSGGQLKSWVDLHGFLHYETGVKSNDTQRKSKGVSTGRVILATRHTAAYDAKTRIPLPSEIEIPEDDPLRHLREAISIGRSQTSKEVIALIEEQLSRLNGSNETDPEKVRAACKAAGSDIPVLVRYLNSLKERTV
jgi:hypothetical protein